MVQIEEISDYVQSLFRDFRKPELLYHNFHHTETVVARATEIASSYRLTKDENFELLTAAWFHDTGHLFGASEMHEEAGAKIMTDFLKPKKIAGSSLEAISACILATHLPAQPKSIIEEILCDADTFHLGTPEFTDIDRLVWDEFDLRHSRSTPDRVGKSIRFLSEHRFFTNYCKELLNDGKQKNLESLKKIQSSIQGANRI